MLKQLHQHVSNGLNTPLINTIKVLMVFIAIYGISSQCLQNINLPGKK